MIVLGLADACPACDPGIPSAAPALSEEPVPGGSVTAHQCECGMAWEARRDEHGWVLGRLAAPVSADRREAA